MGAGEGFAEIHGRAVQQGDVQEEQLHEDHDARLDEERSVEAGAEPVEEPVRDVSGMKAAERAWV